MCLLCIFKNDLQIMEGTHACMVWVVVIVLTLLGIVVIVVVVVVLLLSRKI